MLVSSAAGDRSSVETARPGPDRQQVADAFVEYYGCPPQFAAFDVAPLSDEPAFFTFGGAVGFGRPIRSRASSEPSRGARDLLRDVDVDDARVQLPFDLTEVVTNLRRERYCASADPGFWHELYYLLRPRLPVSIRRRLQRARLRDWNRIAFPRWPVDFSVDDLMVAAMKLRIEANGGSRIPFIWFWPEGAAACATMTHDVESPAGRDFCDGLMDLDAAQGITASFQVIPEGSYPISQAFIARFLARGFEVNVHDLSHDGRLFRTRAAFEARARRINEYGRKLGSRGFRSGAMYRQQDWFDALEFGYDMSVPNCAHLEPQRGGCCTVMPYFVGSLLELPLTTVQDYSLFHILDDYSMSLWRTQTAAILARNGFMSFITHPDYLIEPRARALYGELLAHLCDLRDRSNVWLALPGEVERWWRNRRSMTLVADGDGWRIEGPDAHRASVAFARLEDDTVSYQLAAS